MTRLLLPLRAIDRKALSKVVLLSVDRDSGLAVEVWGFSVWGFRKEVQGYGQEMASIC